jgi:hypothetical protein
MEEAMSTRFPETGTSTPAPRVGGPARFCVCSHSETVHEHYRAGSECGKVVGREMRTISTSPRLIRAEVPVRCECSGFREAGAWTTAQALGMLALGFVGALIIVVLGTGWNVVTGWPS